MTSPIRVLLVDGDADSVRHARLPLPQGAGPGFHVTAVSRLADGIDELSRGEYHVVLLALSLPDSTGLETFRRIQKRARQIPIVVFSNLPEEGVAVDAVRAGAEDYIVKGSVDSATFERVIRFAIERKKRNPIEQETSDEYARTTDLYRRIVEYSQGLICTHDLEGKLLSVNPAAAHSLGYAPDEMIGRNLAEFMSPARRRAVGPYLEKLRKDGVSAGLLPVMTREGDERTWQFRNMLYSETGVPPYVIGYAQDVTELMRGRDEMRRLALTDELTGLHNRRGFLSLAEHTLKVAQRNETDCLLFYADVDDLKKVNDSLGHHVGSSMIAEAAVILRSVFRDSDIVARVGGDEFAVLAIGNTAGNTGLLMNRLLTKLAAFKEAERRPYTLSLSIGVASFIPGSGHTVEQLMRQADHVMYEQKNRYRGTSPGM